MYHDNLDTSEAYSALTANAVDRDEAMTVLVKAYRNGSHSVGRLAVTHIGHKVTAEFCHIGTATFRLNFQGV